MSDAMTAPVHRLRPLDRSLPLALLRARETVMRRFRPLLAEHDLTEQQWRVLRVLHDVDRPLSVGEIADAACLLGPSLSRMLGSLGDRELVTRRGDTSDGRRAEVELSDDGRRLVERIAPSSERVYAGLEEDLGGDELRRIETALARLIALD